MDDSSFGKLAPELRTRIYELVLIRPDPIKLRSSSLRSTPKPPKRLANRMRRNSRRRRHPFALSITCRLMHAECTQLAYARNIFNIPFDAPYSVGVQLQAFRLKIGPKNASALRNVILSIQLMNRSNFSGPLMESIKALQELQGNAKTQCELRVQLTLIDLWPSSRSVMLELRLRDLKGSWDRCIQEAREDFLRQEGLAGISSVRDFRQEIARCQRELANG